MPRARARHLGVTRDEEKVQPGLFVRVILELDDRPFREESASRAVNEFITPGDAPSASAIFS